MFSLITAIVSSSFFLTSSLPDADLDLPVFVSRLLRFRFSITSVASFLLSLSPFLSIFSDNPPDSSLFLILVDDDDLSFSVVNVDDDGNEPLSNFPLFP